MIKILLKLFIENLALWISTSQTTIREFLDQRGCCILNRLERLWIWLAWKHPEVAEYIFYKNWTIQQRVVDTLINRSSIALDWIDFILELLVKNCPSLVVKSIDGDLVHLKDWVSREYIFLLLCLPRILLYLYIILIIAILIIVYIFICTNIIWVILSSEEVLIINTLVCVAAGYASPLNRSYATAPDRAPWMKYEDPFKWDLLNEEPVKKFITKFFDDIVSNCPGDQHIHFIFMVRWEKTFGSFYNDTQYSNIETISKSDILLDRKETINRVLGNIWEHISKDPSDLMISTIKVTESTRVELVYPLPKNGVLPS